MAIKFNIPENHIEKENQNDRENVARKYFSATKEEEKQENAAVKNSDDVSNSNSMKHLRSKWPGRTGKGKRHLDVRPMSFDSLLRGKHKILIPLFQRRYCWTKIQIEQWFQDVLTNDDGQHSTHKTMFKKEYDPQTNETTLICIDGQQRLTTTTLLLMTLRGEARRNDAMRLVDEIDSILFLNDDAILKMKRWAKYQAMKLIRNNVSKETFTMPSLPSGWLPPFDTILTPSYIDRASYYEILCSDYVLEELEKAVAGETTSDDALNRVELQLSTSCQESVQYTAFDIFSTKIKQQQQQQQLMFQRQKQENNNYDGNRSNNNKTMCLLRKLFRNQLIGFSIMYMELLTDANVQHIFLWMQEKSVFGMGSLLQNDHPGIHFTPVDLARNLVVSCVMNLPIEQQVEFYECCWIVPFENKFGTDGVSQILYHLVDPKYLKDNDTSRYIGDMEQKLNMFKLSDDNPMMVYGRFHSYVQERANKMKINSNILKNNMDDSITTEVTEAPITKDVANSIVTEMIEVGKTMGLLPSESSSRKIE